MREGITVEVSAADRARLEAIVNDRNSAQKHVWRARIVLLTADGVGTNEIMLQTGTSKVTVWRWQERFMAAGVAGFFRGKKRAPRIPAPPTSGRQRVGAPTLGQPPGEAEPWAAGTDGPKDRHWRQFGAADLAGARLAAAPGAPIQAVARSGFHAQAAGHRRALCRSAGTCDRAQRRQKIADPGAGPNEPGLPLKPG